MKLEPHQSYIRAEVMIDILKVVKQQIVNVFSTCWLKTNFDTIYVGIWKWLL